jgi:hypothetical protein
MVLQKPSLTAPVDTLPSAFDELYANDQYLDQRVSQITAGFGVLVTASFGTTSGTVAEGSALTAEIARAQAAEGANAAAIGSKAPLDSPHFTGVPTGPTAPAGALTDQFATTAFATSAVSIETGRATTAEAGLQSALNGKASASDLLGVAQDTLTALGGKADQSDQSSVIGNAAKFWSGTYYGNASSGTAPFRQNRILVGTATLSGAGIPATPSTWPETYFGNIIATSQLASISAIGEPAVVGVTRTSDYRTWAGSASGGPPGVGAFTINDDTGSGNPIATAFYGESLHNSGVTGITEVAELTVSSAAPTVAVTPYGGIKGGSTFSLNLTCGFRTGYKVNVSAGLIIGGSRDTATKQQRGIVALASALDPTVGRGGNGVAIELAQGQSVRWLKSDDSVAGEIYAGPNGLAIGPNQIEGAWVAYTPVVKTTGGTVITGVTTDCATIRIGRTVQVRCKITLPASSFGDGTVLVTMPSTPRNNPVWLGRSPSISGPFQAVVSAGAAAANLLSMADASIGAASRQFEFAGTYEAAAD